MRKKAYLIAISIILLFGIFLRFANTPDRYNFNSDSIRDAIVIHEGAKTLSFPLAGPFSSTGPYTFGPWYYIGLIVPSIILPFTYTPWLIMSILSILTIIIMADIGRLLSSKTLGIILAIITAISPTQVSMATGLSNLNPVLFFTTLSIWIILKLIKKEISGNYWYLLLGLSLGMGINAHYQMVGLLALPAFLWIYKGWKRYEIPLLIFLGIFISFIPLIIFNTLTNWSTLRGLQEMMIAKERLYVPNSWKIYLFQFWPSHLKFILFAPLIINISILFVFVINSCWEIIKKKYPAGLYMLIITFALNFLWLRYYWGERHDVYLYYLSPIIFIILGYTLSSLLKTKYGKILFVVFAFFVGWHMLKADFYQIRDASWSEDVNWKKEAQMLQNKYPNNNIVIYSCSSFFDEHKKSLTYLLNFNYKPEATEKPIGLKSHECLYPSTNNFDFRDGKTITKFSTKVYPPIFPIQDYRLSLIDLSPATPSAILKAKWKTVTTKDVFNSVVNWWR